MSVDRFLTFNGQVGRCSLAVCEPQRAARFEVDFSCAYHTTLSVPDMNCYRTNLHLRDQVLRGINRRFGGLQFGSDKVDHIQAVLISDQSAALIRVEVKSHWNSNRHVSSIGKKGF